MRLAIACLVAVVISEAIVIPTNAGPVASLLIGLVVGAFCGVAYAATEKP